MLRFLNKHVAPALTTLSENMYLSAVRAGMVAVVPLTIIGGLFIGFGTRLAGGCTSGHGIFGLSNFELPSLVATVSFMAGGIVTTQLLYRVIFV